jgi:hypothetical protein
MAEDQNPNWHRVLAQSPEDVRAAGPSPPAELLGTRAEWLLGEEAILDEAEGERSIARALAEESADC